MTTGGLEQVQLHLIDSIDEVEAFARWASEDRGRGVYGLDTETTGLHPHYGDRIRTIQVGDRDHGWMVPLEGWGGAVLEILRRLLRRARVVLHNAPFDMSFSPLDRIVPWSSVEDTRPMAWLLDPTRPTGLKTLADRYVDGRASAMEAQLDNAIKGGGWTWATVPIDFAPYWQYGALDPVITVRLYEEIWPRLDDRLREAYALEMSVLPVLTGMMRRGIAVDVEYAKSRADDFERQIESLHAWAKSVHNLRLGSNTQVIDRLLAIGAEQTIPRNGWKRTKGGALAFDKDVKEELAATGNREVRELTWAAQKAAQLTKLKSAYLSHFDKDIIHASINPLGAPKTGRMSISGPSLQNLPRASKDNAAAIEVRNCFVPRSPDNKLAMVDLDQIELRLAAHFSGDVGLLQFVRDPDLDPFNEMASAIFGERITKGDPRRSTTKNAAYATLYGAGPEKFSWTAGITVDQGRAFLDSYYRTFPGIRGLQTRIEQVARDRLANEGRGYVQTPFGHRLVAEPNKLYALTNYLIQATAANMMKRQLVDMSNAGLDEFMVLTVHDEVVFDAPSEIVLDVAGRASEIMRDYETFQAPIRAGVDGPYDRWGIKYLEKD